MKKRLKDEENETVTNCNALKLKTLNRILSLNMIDISNRIYLIKIK